VVVLCLDSGQHRCALHLDSVRCIERSGVGNVPITVSTQTLMAWVCQALSKVSL
jgi:hypothetical protein